MVDLVLARYSEDLRTSRFPQCQALPINVVSRVHAVVKGNSLSYRR
jgi:hypothetical protein